MTNLNELQIDDLKVFHPQNLIRCFLVKGATDPKAKRIFVQVNAETGPFLYGREYRRINVDGDTFELVDNSKRVGAKVVDRFHLIDKKAIISEFPVLQNRFYGDYKLGTEKPYVLKSRVPYREGFKDFGEGSGIRWALFKYPLDPLVLEDDFMEYYGGPGRPFGRHPSVRRVGSRVLITQSVGLDI